MTSADSADRRVRRMSPFRPAPAFLGLLRACTEVVTVTAVTSAVAAGLTQSKSTFVGNGPHRDAWFYFGLSNIPSLGDSSSRYHASRLGIYAPHLLIGELTGAGIGARESAALALVSAGLLIYMVLRLVTAWPRFVILLVTVSLMNTPLLRGFSASSYSGLTFATLILLSFALSAAYLTNFKGLSGCPIALTYTEDGVRDLLKDFSVVSVTKDHIFPYVIEDYIEHRYTVQPYFRSMPEQLFRVLEESLGWHLLVTASPDAPS